MVSAWFRRFSTTMVYLELVPDPSGSLAPVR